MTTHFLSFEAATGEISAHSPSLDAVVDFFGFLDLGFHPRLRASSIFFAALRSARLGFLLSDVLLVDMGGDCSHDGSVRALWFSAL